MTLNEIRSKSVRELITLEKEMKLELTRLSIKKNLGIREAANKLPIVRKNIARIKTVIGEKRTREK
ncbi:50S ribosomal protein L29 [Chloracidobacterium thermophilum]|uniref:50S ribosomal protein L29 n=1 Tax=Chloracidobacterium thermophilum TaxID=458033 RepID=UPI0009D9DFD3|nr:50S ribosomal protein L29 [Chloracidobacterium thermophilum]QUV77990.1 50S ribosomal protein L29 [Chloracidobacterium thermophilum]